LKEEEEKRMERDVLDDIFNMQYTKEADNQAKPIGDEMKTVIKPVEGNR
jgi:hypothetical protein